MATARFAMGDKEYSEAARHLWDTWCIGELVKDGEGTLIHYLVGTGIQRTALEGIRYFAHDKRVPASLIKSLLHRIPQPTVSSPALKRTLKIEFQDAVLPALENLEQTLTSPTFDEGMCQVLKY